MEKNSVSCFAIILFFTSISIAQPVEINGKVIVDDDEIEGIHVINKTSNKFTITKENGTFTIPAKLYDTIVFSAIKYKQKKIIVNFDMLKSKTVNVYLTELVTELNEVFIGKYLTGNLLSDIENSNAKRTINFYDVGIPGYTGRPLTQSENRLHEAGEFSIGMLLGLLMGSVPLNPILNGISGRTKILKNHVRLESLADCLESVKANLSETFFQYNELPNINRADFFYYCMEDEGFSKICQLKNDIGTLEFLSRKLEDYKINLQTKKE